MNQHARARWASAWGATAGVLALTAAAGAQVELRGQLRPLDGEITRVDAKGVEVKAAPGEPGSAVKLIGWDRIRRVSGPHAAEAGRFTDLADGLWRARVRLERHDVRAAELLFDAIYAKHAGLAGPGGAVLAEGVMRTRLLRGATATAIWPWLDWLEIRYVTGKRELDSWVGGHIALPEVLDATRNLSPRLPPIFSAQVDPAGVRLLAEGGSNSQWSRYEQADDAVREVASIYRAAAVFEADPSKPVTLGPIKTTEDHVVMLADIVRARVGSDQERKDARGRLSRRIATLGIVPDDLEAEPGGAQVVANRYLESWCRVALGRSLVRESDPAEVRQGLIEMLHAPARFADVTPELAHLALLDAADVMSRHGDTHAALVLREEAKRRFGPGVGDDWPILDDTAEPGKTVPTETDDEGAG